MPPRLPSGRTASYHCCQCLRKQVASPFASERHQLRDFHASSTDRQRHTRLRKNMHDWLDKIGQKVRDPLPGSTNYLGAYDSSGNLTRLQGAGRQRSKPEQLTDTEVRKIEQIEDDMELDDEQREINALTRAGVRPVEDSSTNDTLPLETLSDLRPYPLNRSFTSQRVLSEDLREKLYQFIVHDSRRLEDVAAAFRIDTRRVAAVVRLKTIEKNWLHQGKKLATSYSTSIMAMLPQTTLSSATITPHESVNDLPVHPRTRQQIFWPASESRQFTRGDAAKAFDDQLLPADFRIPLPALVKAEKLTLQGLSRQERIAILRADNQKMMAEDSDKAARRLSWQERTQTVVPGRRWDFKFQDFNSEKVGKDGRSRTAIGIRYGMPHEDRKRGMVKIPTSVE